MTDAGHGSSVPWIAYIGMGANLGEPIRTVVQAMHDIGMLPHTRLVARSSLYRTAPVGFADQPAFINAVAAVETALTPERLMAELLGIEAMHGRVRDRETIRNGPRRLDLDLLLFGGDVRESDTLRIPHPRAHERAFVLMPLLEIAPDVVIPGRGRARDCLPAAMQQGVQRIDEVEVPA